MAIDDLVTGTNLGNEFDLGAIDADTIRVRIDGTSIQRAPDGTLSAVASGNGTLGLTTMPLYEYSDNWAEESGAISNNNSQWSWGNGDTGNIGLPMGDGWEIYEDYIQADAGGSAVETLSIEVVDRQTVAAGVAFHTFEIIGAGNGQDNNAHIINDLRAAAVAVPDGAVVGFRTLTEVGTWASARVGIRLRRQIGTYVSNVVLL